MRLRYWIRSGLQTFGIEVGASVFYFLLMYIQMDDGFSSILSLLPIYLLVFGAMMVLAMNIGVYKMNLPLVLSFGSTRGEALLGLQLFRLIPTVLTTILLAILCALAGEDAFLPVSKIIPISIGLFLLLGAIGAMIGVVFTKYGKIVSILSAIFILLLAMAVGFFVGYTGHSGFLSRISFSGLPWLILGVGLFFYSVAMIPEQRTVWKCNVKL